MAADTFPTAQIEMCVPDLLKFVDDADIMVADPFVHVRQKTDIVVGALLLVGNGLSLRFRFTTLEFARNMASYR